MANNEVRRILKRQWSLADHSGWGDPVSTNNNLERGSQVDVQLDLEGLADSAYRQGAKMDFSVDGASNELVDFCTVTAALELAATPTDGDVVYLYMAWSNSGTAAQANPAGASGSDAAYTGYSTDADDAIKQADLVATLVVVDSWLTPNVQIIDGGSFVPRARYGCPIVRNESGAAFASTDTPEPETHIVIDGYVYEVQ
jgi:hypothetical protein